MRGFLATPEGRLAVIAVAVFAVLSLLAPDRFLSVQNVTSMAFQFPEFAILALAMTITMLTGGIDLSVVGAANLSAIVAALILTRLAPGATGGDALLWLAIAIAAALAVGLAAGLFNGVAVAVFGLPPILATLGSGLIFTGIAIALTGGSAIMGFPAAAAWLGNATLLAVPVPLVLFALLAAGLAFVLARTAFGLRVQMYGANPLAAHFAGVDVTRLLIRVYAVSGLFAAIAGMVVMSRANSAKADYGSSYLLLAVLIAVLGGVNPYGGYGRVIGVVLAVLSHAVPLLGPQHARGVELRPRADLGGAAPPRHGRQRRRLAAPPRPSAGTEPSNGVRMKKILNNPADYVDEMLDGLVAAHPEFYRLHGDSHRVVARATPGRPGKVGIVTGGGSGHLPVFTGYVGTGLLDACAIGDVFASPSAEQMADAIRAAEPGRRRAPALRQLRRRRDELRHGGRPRRVRGHRHDDRAPRRRRRLGRRPRSARSGAASPAWSTPSRSPAPPPRRGATSPR